jgi:threonine/homoserine/homoserine lactone efflux protein
LHVTAAFSHVLAFTAAAAVLVATPGLDTAVVLRQAAVGGPKSATLAAGGVVMGLLVWGLTAAAGLTAVLLASRLAYTALSWAGAAYLVVAGVRMLLDRDTHHRPVTSDLAPMDGDGVVSFRRGLLTNLLNPKVGLFYVTFLPQFIPSGASVGAFALMLAGIHLLLTTIWFSVLVIVSVPARRLLTKPTFVRTLNRAAGCVFVGFGLKLAASPN